MNRNLSAPKILPWAARKAGISDELALKLWRRAVSEAEFLAGKAEGPDYWGLSVERFLALVEDEVGEPVQYSPNPVQRLSWIWRYQNRMAQLSLMAIQNSFLCWQNACLYWQKTWGKVCAQHKIAA